MLFKKTKQILESFNHHIHLAKSALLLTHTVQPVLAVETTTFRKSFFLYTPHVKS